MLKFFIGLNGLISLFFWRWFYTSYWQYRHLFNEEGRYFDEEQGVVYDGNGIAFAMIASFFTLIMLILIGFHFLNKYKNSRVNLTKH